MLRQTAYFPCRPERPGAVGILGAVVLAGVFVLAGCGTPPELRSAAPTRSSTTSPVPPSPATPSAEPSQLRPAPHSPFVPTDAGPAVDCAGRPSGRQIVALLRRADILPAGVAATVRTPPLCAGTWQFTVIEVAGHEPLQVVTEGDPTRLRLVTAGTDVCTVQVRAAAPAGVRSLACDLPPPPPA